MGTVKGGVAQPPSCLGPRGFSSKNDCETLCKQQGCSQERDSSPQRGFSSRGVRLEKGPFCSPVVWADATSPGERAGPRARGWQPPPHSTRVLCVSPRPALGLPRPVRARAPGTAGRRAAARCPPHPRPCSRTPQSHSERGTTTACQGPGPQDAMMLGAYEHVPRHEGLGRCGWVSDQ